MSRFPPSDHCDGERFFNPGAASDQRGLVAVFKWRFGEKRQPWQQPAPDPSYPPPPPQVEPGHVAVTAIGHASFLLRFPGLTVLTDPVFSQRCSPVQWAGPRRVRPPGVALADLPPIDLLLLSHNHYDHMDMPSLRGLLARGPAPRVVTTLGNRDRLLRLGFTDVAALDWWQAAAVDGWTVTATPARHFSRRGFTDGNRSLWAGFMLDGPDGRVLFAGDSGAGPHWADIQSRLGPPGLALLPIGAYEPAWLMRPVHMNPAEAVAAHAALGSNHSLAMHWGVFRLTDEAIDAPPRALAAALEGQGLPPFAVPGFGETRVIRLS